MKSFLSYSSQHSINTHKLLYSHHHHHHQQIVEDVATGKRKVISLLSRPHQTTVIIAGLGANSSDDDLEHALVYECEGSILSMASFKMSLPTDFGVRWPAARGYAKLLTAVMEDSKVYLLLYRPLDGGGAAIDMDSGAVLTRFLLSTEFLEKEDGVANLAYITQERTHLTWSFDAVDQVGGLLGQVNYSSYSLNVSLGRQNYPWTVRGQICLHKGETEGEDTVSLLPACTDGPPWAVSTGFVDDAAVVLVDGSDNSVYHFSFSLLTTALSPGSPVQLVHYPGLTFWLTEAGKPVDAASTLKDGFLQHKAVIICFAISGFALLTLLVCYVGIFCCGLCGDSGGGGGEVKKKTEAEVDDNMEKGKDKVKDKKKKSKEKSKKEALSKKPKKEAASRKSKKKRKSKKAKTDDKADKRSSPVDAPSTPVAIYTPVAPVTGTGEPPDSNSTNNLQTKPKSRASKKKKTSTTKKTSKMSEKKSSKMSKKKSAKHLSNRDGKSKKKKKKEKETKESKKRKTKTKSTFKSGTKTTSSAAKTTISVPSRPSKSGHHHLRSSRGGGGGGKDSLHKTKTMNKFSTSGTKEVRGPSSQASDWRPKMLKMLHMASFKSRFNRLKHSAGRHSKSRSKSRSNSRSTTRSKSSPATARKKSWTKKSAATPTPATPTTTRTSKEGSFKGKTAASTTELSDSYLTSVNQQSLSKTILSAGSGSKSRNRSKSQSQSKQKMRGSSSKSRNQSAQQKSSTSKQSSSSLAFATKRNQ